MLLAPFALAGAWLYLLYRGVAEDMPVSRPEPLRVAVTDPLCGRLAPDYLRDRAGRDYAPLGIFLQGKLGRPVEILYHDSPRAILQSHRGQIDLVIGKTSTVSFEAAQANEPVRPIVRLTDGEDVAEVWGLFVVRTKSPAQAIRDLADHRILFGPPRDAERYSQALALLAENGVAPLPPLQVVPDCVEALVAVAKGDADVAVMSSYALPLLDGFAGVEKGTLRVVGQTAPQPFISAFATARSSPATERTVRDALLSARTDPQLLAALQSKSGFVELEKPPIDKPPPPAQRPVSEWTDWRGPGRNGISPDVPAGLPATRRLLWKRRLIGAGLSGVSATGTHVIVADKNEPNDQDIWRCLDAETGRELWTVAYPTPRELEFTNTPRATPVIHGGFAYLLGAFGDLHCVSVEGCRIVWRRNIVKEFNAKLPKWGMCSTPLIVDDAIIVNPGAPDASLVAVGLYTGETIWRAPGEPAGYGSLILGTFGGVRQIVGHDATSLGGWDPNTGRRLWTLLPTKKGDFNVPTPVNIDGRLLVATENNGARLYDFDADGRINPIPVAQNRKLAPDTSTPVVMGNLVFGCFRGLFCLDVNDNLKTLYSTEGDGSFNDYAALIAGNGRILAVTVEGELILLEAAREAFRPLSRLRLFDDAEVWSHPALVGNRLYIRSMKEICCFLLDD
jgi:ABC-type phosphate/phosphonate transport system substrate-binding protein/outer membrane protein assembly factor BamB